MSKEQQKDYFNTIKIDLSRDDILTDQAKTLLREFYMLKHEKSPQEAFARAAVAYSYGDVDFAQRIYDYASKGWFMYASPVLSNAPEPGQMPKGLPISCYLQYVPDSLEGLIDHTTELRWLSVKGGGVGGHWSDVRAVSDKAPGPIPFIHTVDADMLAYKQGKTRKGSYAAYLRIDHPDIREFINLRVPTGDANRKCLNIHNAVVISDDFMKAVENDDEWNLIDPDDKTVRDTLKARKLWEELLEIRFRTGEPYFMFVDNAMKQFPVEQKNRGLEIRGSNLCCEIFLATSKDRTAVCCLSSLNVEKFDEWKDTRIVEDLTRLLDNVLSFFITHAPSDTLKKAINSAISERSIGIGLMGLHSYLQFKGIPFESEQAVTISDDVAKTVKHRAAKESEYLAVISGECPDFVSVLTISFDDGSVQQISSSDMIGESFAEDENGLTFRRAFQLKEGDSIKGRKIVKIEGRTPNQGRRNAHLMAIAPNANSSMITGCSPSIEPFSANAYVHKTRAGSHLIKNSYLVKVLEELGENTQDVWDSIIEARGSVQHLDFLPGSTKEVFKTADEIDQRWVIRHAAARQKHVCQGQSVNLFFPAGVDRGYVNEVHYLAWKLGLKGLYYLRTSSVRNVKNISKHLERVALKDGEEDVESKYETCKACEG